MELSTIVVTWNCRPFVSKCLRSITTQLPGNSELIVVDNASSDGTSDAVRVQFPGAKVIDNAQNVGFARGNNLGIVVSTGKYLCLINPDVVVGPDCINRMLEFMAQHPNVGILAPKILGADGKAQRSCMRTPTLWNQLCRALALDRLTKTSRLFGGYLMADFRHDHLRDVDIANGCFWMVRRAAVEEIGMLDAAFWMYGEDLDWCQRYRRAGWRVVFFPSAEALHFGGGSSQHIPLLCRIEMLRADLQYWRKYHSVLSSCVYLAILYLGQAVRIFAYCAMYMCRPNARPKLLVNIKAHSGCMWWLALHGITAGRAFTLSGRDGNHT